MFAADILPFLDVVLLQATPSCCRSTQYRILKYHLSEMEKTIVKQIERLEFLVMAEKMNLTYSEWYDN